MAEIKMRKSEIRTVIKYLVKKRMLSFEIKDELKNTLGAAVPSSGCIKKWVMYFKNRQEIETKNMKRSARSYERFQNKIDKILELVLMDSRIGNYRLCNTMQMSIRSVNNILTNILHMRKIASRWVPRLLSSEQTLMRVIIARKHIELYESDPQDFLDRYVTVDHIWVYYTVPKLQEIIIHKDNTLKVMTANEMEIHEIAANELASNEIEVNEMTVKETTHNEMTANAMANSEMTDNEMEVYETTGNEMEANEMTINEMTANEMANDDITIKEMTNNEMEVYETAINEMEANEMPIKEMTVNEMANNEMADNEIEVIETTANKMANNEMIIKEITANELVNNEMTRNEKEVNATTANAMEGNEMTVNEKTPNEMIIKEMTVSEMTANETANNEIEGKEMANNEMANNELIVNEMAVKEMLNNDIPADVMANNEIPANEMADKEIESVETADKDIEYDESTDKESESEESESETTTPDLQESELSETENSASTIYYYNTTKSPLKEHKPEYYLGRASTSQEYQIGQQTKEFEEITRKCEPQLSEFEAEPYPSGSTNPDFGQRELKTDQRESDMRDTPREVKPQLTENEFDPKPCGSKQEIYGSEQIAGGSQEIKYKPEQSTYKSDETPSEASHRMSKMEVMEYENVATTSKLEPIAPEIEQMDCELGQTTTELEPESDSNGMESESEGKANEFAQEDSDSSQMEYDPLEEDRESEQDDSSQIEEQRAYEFHPKLLETVHMEFECNQELSEAEHRENRSQRIMRTVNLISATSKQYADVYVQCDDTPGIRWEIPVDKTDAKTSTVPDDKSESIQIEHEGTNERTDQPKVCGEVEFVSVSELRDREQTENAPQTSSSSRRAVAEAHPNDSEVRVDFSSQTEGKPFLQCIEKVLMTVFWDAKGVIFTHYQDDEATPEYFVVLLEALADRIEKTRPEKVGKRIYLHQTASRPQNSTMVMAKMFELGFDVLEQPPHSPDISPTDYFLLPSMKANFKATRFADKEESHAKTDSILSEIHASAYKKAIASLYRRWQACIQDRGDYLPGYVK